MSGHPTIALASQHTDTYEAFTTHKAEYLSIRPLLTLIRNNTQHTGETGPPCILTIPAPSSLLGPYSSGCPTSLTSLGLSWHHLLISPGSCLPISRQPLGRRTSFNPARGGLILSPGLASQSLVAGGFFLKGAALHSPSTTPESRMGFSLFKDQLSI